MTFEFKRSGGSTVISPKFAQRPTVEAVRRGQHSGIPKPGDVVTAKVTRINPHLASLDILCVGDQPLDTTFTGVIRCVPEDAAGAYKPQALCPPRQQQHCLDNGLDVERIAEATLVISHADAGSLFEALGAGKLVIAVPNVLLMHNHQVELAEELAAAGHFTCAPAGLAPMLRGLDHAALKTPPACSPAGIAAGIDHVMDN